MAQVQKIQNLYFILPLFYGSVFYSLLFFFFLPHHAASTISQPGIEPMLSAEEVRGLIHWTTREIWGGFLKTAFGLRDTRAMTCPDVVGGDSVA